MSSPRLFPPPPESLVRGLHDFERLLGDVFPLRPKHRAALAAQVRTLSGYLTIERDQLPYDYMNQPPLLGAYLYYFLPWNLYRQGRLLAGLDLCIKPGSRLLDVGAGPLTFLLVLWLARPGMRDQPLQYLGQDRSDLVLKYGRRLFKGLAGSTPWSVRTENRPAGVGRGPVADILVMANFLNELETSGGGRRRQVAGERDDATSYDKMVARWGRMVADDAAILLIEPGMRTAGRNLVRLRAAALDQGWRVLAPCPHQAACPMPGQRHTAWCHFNFAADGAPLWLEKLSRRAKLPKDRASLSFLLLTRGDNPPLRVAQPVAQKIRTTAVRAVSGAFDLPDWQRGSYGCSDQGLVLLQDRQGSAAPGPRPGDLVQVVWPAAPDRDGKSGAWILPRSR